MPHSRLLSTFAFFATLALTASAHAQISPNDALQTCKNTASDRLPNVPRAFITVQRGTDAGGNYMINFRAQPLNGRPSSGFCIIGRNGRVNDFQFDRPIGGGGGGHNNWLSPQDAAESCKNLASTRMPETPRAFINVDRARDTGDGNYLINFRSNPPNRPGRSGFCQLYKDGRLHNFQFDGPPPNFGNGGGNPNQNFGGQNPYDVMRSCKSAVSAQFPNVPLAYIEVDQPRVNGASMLSAFRVRPPNARPTRGACDVFRNGRVNLSYDRR